MHHPPTPVAPPLPVGLLPWHTRASTLAHARRLTLSTWPTLQPIPLTMAMPSQESMWSCAATKDDTHDTPIMVAPPGVCITVLCPRLPTVPWPPASQRYQS